jgi:hypothetical protein
MRHVSILLFGLQLAWIVSTFTASGLGIPHSKRKIVPSRLCLLRVSTNVANAVANAPASESASAPEEEEDSSPPAQKARCITGVAPRDGPLNEAVARIANLTSLQQANSLIQIGAVWARMAPLSEEEVLALYDDDGVAAGSSRALYADLPSSLSSPSSLGNKNDDDDDDGDADLEKYMQQMESQRFRRILAPSWMEAGTDIRIYPNPRRFPAWELLTRDRLLYEDTTFLVVDKPPMLPTQPDASNYKECCPGAVQDNMGPFYDVQGKLIARPLLCHRVDASVGGCVVLGKDRNGQKVFDELQRQRQLRKVYLAVTTCPVPIGRHVHWMWAGQSARGNRGGPPCQLVSHCAPESRRKARQFWSRCVLEVVKCEPIEIDSDDDDVDAVHDYQPAPGIQHYQSTIRLVSSFSSSRGEPLELFFSHGACPLHSFCNTKGDGA